jgi:hypothetical protein
MSLDDIENRLSGLIHSETQRHDGGVDLTLAAVHAISGPGQVDFGGGELTESNTSKIEPAKRSADDDYGWWHLGGGTYLVEYNESLSGADPAQLQPRTELAERGCSHPTLRVTALPRMPLAVPPAGVQLKENARVSTLCPLG